MAKIIYSAPIEEASGAFTKINTKSTHRDDQVMFLGTHRLAATMSLSCSRAYFRKINNLPWQKSTGIIDAEVSTLRNSFSAKATAIKNRMTDLTAITDDQINFRELLAEYKAKHGSSFTQRLFMWAGAKKYQDPEHVLTINWPASGGIQLTLSEIESAVAANKINQK